MPPPAHPQPEFVDGPAGAIFTLRYAAASATSARPAALLLPPFGEEMNRARRFLAASARALAAHGCTAVLADLHGTGDSAGAFVDADWSTWQAEAEVLTERLAAETGCQVRLVALRAGALLAAETGRKLPRAVGGLTLLQPVSDGRRFLDQLLRVRVAASMAQGLRQSRDGLRAQWKAGETVEVGGYAISPALADQLSRQRLNDLPPPADLPVDWVDVVAPNGDSAAPHPPLPAGWNGAYVTYSRVAAPPVWQLQEPTTAETLTAALVDRLDPRPEAA